MNTVDPQLPPSDTFKINKVECLFAIRAICRIQLGLNHKGAQARHAQLIDQIRHMITSLAKVRVEVECCRSCDDILPRSWITQPPGSCLQALWFTTHGPK